MLGGAVEAAAGYGFAAFTATTGLGAALGVAVGLHGTDNALAGYYAMMNGTEQTTLTSQGLQSLGVSPDTARGIDAGIGMVGTMGVGAAMRAGQSVVVNEFPSATVSSVPSASTPVGRLGSPISVQSGLNQPTTIYGRGYTMHALDRMQERGLTPTVIEATINQSVPIPARNNTYIHIANGIKVIVNEIGTVVTAIPQ